MFQKDVFSYGMVLYEMFAGKYAFQGIEDNEVLKTINILYKF